MNQDHAKRFAENQATALQSIMYFLIPKHPKHLLHRSNGRVCTKFLLSIDITILRAVQQDILDIVRNR